MAQPDFVCNCPLSVDSVHQHVSVYIRESDALIPQAFSIIEGVDDHGERIGLGFCLPGDHSNIAQCTTYLQHLDMISNAFVQRAVQIIQDKGAVTLKNMHVRIEPNVQDHESVDVGVFAYLDS